ncbi:MAG TPA: hypothetical protein VMG59_09200 [Phycisphaerae bacterium]|nr:hypothetical protein [Phycisphaerae bacterium]
MPKTTSENVDLDIVRWILLGLAIVVIFIGFFSGVALYSIPLKFGNSTLSPILWVPLGIAGGVLFALPILFASMLLKAHKVEIRRLAELGRSIEQMQQRLVALDSIRPLTVKPAEPERPGISSLPSATPSAPVFEPADASHMIELLASMRDLLLMTDVQRQHYAARVWEKKKALLIEEFHDLIRREQWATAAAAVERFRESLPGDPVADQLGSELSHRHAQRMQEDIAAYRKEIEPLMSINLWDRVKELMARLEAKYPSQVQVAELSDRINKEYQIWRNDEFQRLLVEYKEAGDHRQWRRAYNIALQFSERFSDNKLVDRIRLDIPTLQRNADIQDCQELVHQFKDLSQRHRYEEAFGVAERVISTFPDSSAAADLQKMLPKLQELIEQENARRRTSAGLEIT